MPSLQVSPAKVEIDFTDEKLTGHGGRVFLGRLFKQLKLGRRIGEAIHLKRRRRGAWATGRLHPGGVSATEGWQAQLEAVAPWIDEGTPVWVHVDNACYSHGFVDFCHARGWDYSVSVTHDGPQGCLHPS